MHISVQGGTNAGHRIVKQQVRKSWKCPACKALNAYYWASCANCNHPREHS